MKTNNKSSSAPLAMTFLLLSLAIVPVSMKATGFSPNLSAVVDAWNRIAGVFGDGYHAAQTTELLALNQADTNQTPTSTSDSCCLTTLLASIEKPVVVEGEPAQAIVDVETTSDSELQTRQAAVKRSSETKRVRESVAQTQSETKKELRVVAFEVQEMVSVAPVIHAETMKAFEKQAALHQVDLNRALRNLPVRKDMKVLIKAKSLAFAAPQVSRCGSSSVGKPATKAEWIWSMMPALPESAPRATSETSEL